MCVSIDLSYQGRSWYGKYCHYFGDGVCHSNRFAVIVVISIVYGRPFPRTFGFETPKGRTTLPRRVSEEEEVDYRTPPVRTDA